MIVAQAAFFVHWLRLSTVQAVEAIIGGAIAGAVGVVTLFFAFRKYQRERAATAQRAILDRCWKLQKEAWELGALVELQREKAIDSRDDPAVFEAAWEEFLREREERRRRNNPPLH